MVARKPPIGAPPRPISVTSRLVRPTLRRASAMMLPPRLVFTPPEAGREAVPGHAPRTADGPPSLLDDTELVAVRVSQHDVVSARGVSPLDSPRAERKQPTDLGLLVGRVEIEMVALMRL